MFADMTVMCMHMGMIAGDKGIERFHAVDQAMAGQEFQRTVNRWRFGASDIGLESIQQIIGFYSRAIFNDQLQHMGAQWGKPFPCAFHNVAGPVYSAL